MAGEFGLCHKRAILRRQGLESRVLDLSLEIILEQVPMDSAMRLCCFCCEILVSFHLGLRRG